MGCNTSRQVKTEPIKSETMTPPLGSRRPNMRATAGAAMRRYGSLGRGKWTATDSTTHPDMTDPGVQRVAKICGF